MRIRILILSLFLIVLTGIPCLSQGAEEWEAIYNELRGKIIAEKSQPPLASKDISEYIKWMNIKANDRDKAKDYTSQAQRAGNPYWANRFSGLVDMAQESGDTTVLRSAVNFMEIKGKASGFRGDNWETAVFKAGPNIGQKLFSAAAENGLDKEIIREYARCLMRFANGNVEEGERGLYRGRRSELGHLDEEGVLVPPKEGHDLTCERRDAFTTIDEGEPEVPADEAMEWVQRIRKICKWYKLQGEFEDATDLMEQYLKEKKVLCDLPPNKGHYFFLNLAEKYDLPDAEEHIDGFYATIYGKVEVWTEEGRKPARGAKVTVRAPKDKDAPKNRREWTANADDDGKYKMKRVILHKDCAPFEIKAEYKGVEEETTYDGPLEEPDSSYEYEKDLLIRPLWEGRIESTYEIAAKGDEALVTAMMPKSEYQAKGNWTLEVVFMQTRGNDRIKVYELKSAKIKFSEEFKAEIKMQKEGRRIQMNGSDGAQLSGRELTPSECDLELILDLKKKTYKIEGLLYVENIPEEGESRFVIDVGPIQHDEKDTGEGMTEIREEILLEGKFSQDDPEKFEGDLDEIAEIPPEFKEFMEALAGKISGKIRWKFLKKGVKE